MTEDDELMFLGRMIIERMEAQAYAAQTLPKIIAVKTNDTGQILRHKVLSYKYVIEYNCTVSSLLIDIIRNLQHFNIEEVSYEYYWNGDEKNVSRHISIENLNHKKSKGTEITFIYNQPDP